MTTALRTYAKGPCRDCTQVVLWVTVTVDGVAKRLPVDPYPDEDGTVAVRKGPRPGDWLGYYVTAERPLAPGWKLCRNHVATCPNRDRSRDPKPAGEPDPTLF